MKGRYTGRSLFPRRDDSCFGMQYRYSAVNIQTVTMSAIQINVPMIKDFEKYYMLKLLKAGGGKMEDGRLTVLEMSHIIYRTFFLVKKYFMRNKEWLERKVWKFDEDLPTIILPEQLVQEKCRTKVFIMMKMGEEMIQRGQDRGFGESVTITKLYHTFAACMAFVMFVNKTAASYAIGVRNQGYKNIDDYLNQCFDHYEDWLLLELSEVCPVTWNVMLQKVFTWDDTDPVERLDIYNTIREAQQKYNMKDGPDYNWLYL